MPTAPSYVANAGVNAGNGSGSRTLYLPAGYTAGQIVIISAQAEGGTYDIATPSGYNLIATWLQGDAYGAWFWRRLDGTETNGDRNVTRTSTSGLFSIMVSTWGGCIATGTPFTSAGPAKGTSNTVSSSSITPGVGYCCVACFISVEDNWAIGTLSGGSYAERYDATSGAGNGCAYACDSYAQTTAANEPARTASIAASEHWATMTLAFIPSSGWSHKINGIAAANIAKVNGIAIASVSKIKGVA